MADRLRGARNRAIIAETVERNGKAKAAAPKEAEYTIVVPWKGSKTATLEHVRGGLALTFGKGKCRVREK